MNISGKTLIPLFLAGGMLASCNSFIETPTISPEDSIETAISTVSQPALASGTPVPLTFTPTPAPESYLVVDAGRRPNVWNGPGTHFDVIGPLGSPKKYPVIGRHLDWWKLDLGNHRSGWIHAITYGTRFVGNAETVPDAAPPSLPARPVRPTSTPLVFTDPSIPLSERIVYYYDIEYHPNSPVPEGTIIGSDYIAPTYADQSYTSDTAADLRTALEIVLHDRRNDWIGESLDAEIADITFRSGHAKVLLQGEYFLAGPEHRRYAVLEAARVQILLTLFANPAVQTAAVLLNEDTIANLGISESRDAKPANYVFTRLEIETYLKEYTYVPPSPTKTPTPFVFASPTPPGFIDPSLPLPGLPPGAMDLRWITAYGLPGDQTVTKIHPTKDGGFILVGNEVLLRLRADGLILWQTYLGQVGALDVLETSAGDFMVAADRHWIKLDSEGDVFWGYTFEEPSYHTGPILRLVEENNGNIVVEALGSRTVFSADGELQSITEYAMNWDSQTYSGRIEARSGETLWTGGAGSHEYWVGKADRNNGWLNIFSFPEKPIGGSPLIQTTADGGALVSVPIYGEGGYDLLISRISRDGSVRWQTVFGGYVSEPHIVFETRSGDFIIAGSVTYYSAFSFRDDVRIMRLDRNGNIRWIKAYGTEGWAPEGQDAVTAIQELSNGDLLFAGHTNGTRTGDQDMWVLKMNAEGEIPGCSLALDRRGVWTGGVSSEVETIALKGISVIERETIPILEEEQGLDDAAARTHPLCSPSP